MHGHFCLKHLPKQWQPLATHRSPSEPVAVESVTDETAYLVCILETTLVDKMPDKLSKKLDKATLEAYAAEQKKARIKDPVGWMPTSFKADSAANPKWDDIMQFTWELIQPIREMRSDGGKEANMYSEQTLQQVPLAINLLTPNHAVVLELKTAAELAALESDPRYHRVWHGTAASNLIDIVKCGHLKPVWGAGDRVTLSGGLAVWGF